MERQEIKGIPRNKEEFLEYLEDSFCIFSDFFAIGFGVAFGAGVAYSIIQILWLKLA